MKKEAYRIINSRKIYDGHIIKLVKDRFVLKAAPDKVVTRELIIHPGAVAVIPYANKNTIVMLRQFRYSAGGDIWEIPAGTLEAGEETISCAKRELEEETGFRAKLWTKLGQFFLAPGISNEIMTLYRADHLCQGLKKLDHDEWIRHELVSVIRAKKMIREGKIRDAKTIAGILWPQV